MYSKQETAQIKQSFWTSFGQYMKPVPFAAEEKNSWINYKTGVPHIYFRMTAEKKSASVAIELVNPSAAIREHQMEQLVQQKNILQTVSGKEWVWEEARISQTLKEVNIFNEADWPAMISFLKAGIRSLDAFWEEVKYAFE